MPLCCIHELDVQYTFKLVSLQNLSPFRFIMRCEQSFKLNHWIFSSAAIWTPSTAVWKLFRAWTFWRHDVHCFRPGHFGATTSTVSGLDVLAPRRPLFRAWTFWRHDFHCFGPGRFGVTTSAGRSDVASLTSFVGFGRSPENKLLRKRAKTATGNQVEDKQMSGPVLSEAKVAVPF